MGIASWRKLVRPAEEWMDDKREGGDREGKERKPSEWYNVRTNLPSSLICNIQGLNIIQKRPQTFF